MSLYEMFMKILDVAEQIGQIKEINMRGKSKYCKAGGTVSGVDNSGRKFTLELELEDEEAEEVAEKLE